MSLLLYKMYQFEYIFQILQRMSLVNNEHKLYYSIKHIIGLQLDLEKIAYKH